jgi:Ras homolog gene family, member A
MGCLYTDRANIQSFLPPVIEAFVKEIQIDGKEIEIAVQDTPGDDVYARLRPLYYADTNIAAICFSVEDKDSFEHAEHKWLPEVYHSRPGIPIILIACKVDLRHHTGHVEYLKRNGERLISTEEGDAMAQRMGANAYIECSAMDGTGVDELIHKVVSISYHSVGKRPKRHYCSVI